MICDIQFILWMSNCQESLSEEVERIKLTINTLQTHTSYFSNIYMKTKDPRTKQAFSNERSEIEKMILHNRRKIAAAGSTFGFYSENEHGNYNGISITSGVKNIKLINTIVINLSSVDVENSYLLSNLEAIFIKLIEINKPLFACVSDLVAINNHRELFDRENQTPKNVYWLNYWNDATLKNIEIGDYFDKLIRINDGCFLRNGERPLDLSDENQLNYQMDINDCVLGTNHEIR